MHITVAIELSVVDDVNIAPVNARTHVTDGGRDFLNVISRVGEVCIAQQLGQYVGSLCLGSKLRQVISDERFEGCHDLGVICGDVMERDAVEMEAWEKLATDIHQDMELVGRLALHLKERLVRFVRG